MNTFTKMHYFFFKKINQEGKILKIEKKYLAENKNNLTKIFND